MSQARREQAEQFSLGRMLKEPFVKRPSMTVVVSEFSGFVIGYDIGHEFHRDIATLWDFYVEDRGYELKS